MYLVGHCLIMINLLKAFGITIGIGIALVIVAIVIIFIIPAITYILLLGAIFFISYATFKEGD